MAESQTTVPVKKSEDVAKHPWSPQAWHPIASLRREMERLFDDFDHGTRFTPARLPRFGLEPFWRHDWSMPSAPSVDLSETEKTYELTAELPGMDEKDIEVKLANGGLTIKGEKREEKEEKEKDYYLRERRFGSFERYFQLPDGVDADKIEARFNKGVLTITLPKTVEAQSAAKKIPVKGA
ncbi:Hsp20/alpha crystallin family protein [Cupriavidus pinatubonensis]|uniref:Hsp20/alpha crystallin family protein n=1 Tax=Cupriavidus pinatubonensis TaxID=248026 RepID=UPI00112E61EA|nr:Hsp20/alpha crystallin family protein [Cupriavidus pinatubonensis]QYY32738.1 Hsp20/alpha crystallin family protein [Cupriavidus pinatubonensis]TPQ42766.1 molecular chaperone Hsp20 [Cupriavidus pinatubonensis]